MINGFNMQTIVLSFFFNFPNETQTRIYGTQDKYFLKKKNRLNSVKRCAYFLPQITGVLPSFDLGKKSKSTLTQQKINPQKRRRNWILTLVHSCGCNKEENGKLWWLRWTRGCDAQKSTIIGTIFNKKKLDPDGTKFFFK